MDKAGGNVLIAGLGLLGASLAMALKRAGGFHVSGWTRNAAVRDSLLRRGVIQETAESPDALIQKADITILCMPVPQITEFVKEHAALWRPGAIVSDVGSVKGPIVEQAGPALAARGAEFLGGHPMAGSEKSGPEAASESLFDKAVVFLTPVENSSPKALASLRSLWEKAGARPHEASPEAHDAVMAGASHLPHALAWALALSVLEKEGEDAKLAKLACASSFKDMTRVASSSPELWAGIFEANRECLLDSIDGFQRSLQELKALLEESRFDELKERIAKGKALTDAWRSGKYGH